MKNTRMLILTLAVAGGLWLLPAAADPNFGAALAGWWQFNETSGGTAADSSGLGNDGMLASAAGFTTDSLLGNAVDITGTSGGILVPHDASLEPAEGTIQAWFKVAALQDADLFGKVSFCRVRTDPTCTGTTGFSVIGLRLRADGGIVTFVANDDPVLFPALWTVLNTTAGLYTANTWHHVAIRWDGTTFALFVDGVLQQQASYDPVPGLGLSYSGPSPFFFGFPTAGPHGGEFIGQIDDARFYGRARADVEIFSDYVTMGHKPAKPVGQ